MQSYVIVFNGSTKLLNVAPWATVPRIGENIEITTDEAIITYRVLKVTWRVDARNKLCRLSPPIYPTVCHVSVEFVGQRPKLSEE